MKHLEVDGVSWCQCTVNHTVISASYRARVELVCQSDDETIDTAAAWLRENWHANAVAVDGPCRQRDAYAEDTS